MRTEGRARGMPGGQAAVLPYGSIPYPHAAEQLSEQGVTVAHFTIDTQGRARDCAASGATPILNAHACDVIARQFLYAPARDAHGVAIEQSETKRIVWRMVR